MSKNKIEEVNHKTSSNVDAGLALLTLGGALLVEQTRHEVTVRDSDGDYGVGTGKTHEEARRNAIRDLNN